MKVLWIVIVFVTLNLGLAKASPVNCPSFKGSYTCESFGQAGGPYDGMALLIEEELNYSQATYKIKRSNWSSIQTISANSYDQGALSANSNDCSLRAYCGSNSLAITQMCSSVSGSHTLVVTQTDVWTKADNGKLQKVGFKTSNLSEIPGQISDLSTTLCSPRH